MQARKDRYPDSLAILEPCRHAFKRPALLSVLVAAQQAPFGQSKKREHTLQGPSVRVPSAQAHIDTDGQTRTSTDTDTHTRNTQRPSNTQDTHRDTLAYAHECIDLHVRLHQLPRVALSQEVQPHTQMHTGTHARMHKSAQTFKYACISCPGSRWARKRNLQRQQTP